MSSAPVLSNYLAAAMRQARFEPIDDGAQVYGEIPGLGGVYATGATQDECATELREVLEEWLLLGISMHHDIPSVGGIDLRIHAAS